MRRSIAFCRTIPALRSSGALTQLAAAVIIDNTKKLHEVIEVPKPVAKYRSMKFGPILHPLPLVASEIQFRQTNKCVWQQLFAMQLDPHFLSCLADRRRFK